MGERLTIEEIRRQYDGRWVLTIEPELNAANKTASGIVAAHSFERDESL